MTERSNTLPIIALIIGIIGMGLGGYVVVGDLLQGDDTPAVIPKAKVYVDVTQTLQRSIQTTINFTSISFDSHDAFNITSDQYRLPETGQYLITTQFCVYAYPNDFFAISVWSGGTLVLRGAFTAAPSTSTNYFAVSITGIISGDAGDMVDVLAYFYNGTVGASRNIFANEAYTYFSIVKVP